LVDERLSNWTGISSSAGTRRQPRSHGHSFCSFFQTKTNEVEGGNGAPRCIACAVFAGVGLCCDDSHSYKVEDKQGFIIYLSPKGVCLPRGFVSLSPEGRELSPEGDLSPKGACNLSPKGACPRRGPASGGGLSPARAAGACHTCIVDWPDKLRQCEGAQAPLGGPMRLALLRGMAPTAPGLAHVRGPGAGRAHRVGGTRAGLRAPESGQEGWPGDVCHLVSGGGSSPEGARLGGRGLTSGGGSSRGARAHPRGGARLRGRGLTPGGGSSPGARAHPRRGLVSGGEGSPPEGARLRRGLAQGGAPESELRHPPTS